MYPPVSPGSGDEGIRTPDPLLARQVLSQLSYTPIGLGYYSIYMGLHGPHISGLNGPFLHSEGFYIPVGLHGLKWTRTIDLTLIRRAL